MSAIKQHLEGLLREHRLERESPPFGTVPRSSVATGIKEIDALIGGGFSRGQLSEIHGPASSGRTGVALSLVARATRRGALAAWVDPGDGLDPISVIEAGVETSRLLWVRECASLQGALAALATLIGSSLFEVTVLDLVGVSQRDLRRLPASTWIRLQRMVELTPLAVVVLAEHHTTRGPRGTSLALGPSRPRFTGKPGPARLLRGLVARGAAGHRATEIAAFDLRATGH